MAKNIRSKSMPATATRLVQGVWQHYFKLPESLAMPIVDEDMEDIIDEEELDQEADLTQSAKKPDQRKRATLTPKKRKAVSNHVLGLSLTTA